MTEPRAGDAGADAPDGRLVRVLMVEDSRFDEELLRVQLLRIYPNARLRVVDAQDDFVEALEGGGWDLVLSDFELPGFTGADLLRHRNRIAPDLPFVFVSGVIGEDNAVELMKQGATDYVSKGRLARLAPVLQRAMREVDARRSRDLAERQLRQADMTFAKVVDSLRDYAVMLLDDAGRIQFWNPAASELFGYRREDVLGRSAALLFPEPAEASLQAELAQARASGKATDNRWMVAQGGRRLWAEGVLTALEDDTGRRSGFCKLVHDATEAHLAGQALQAAKEEADHANRSKDRFLAVLSHELRTPLAPIMTAVHVLERAARVDERHRDLLPMIRRNVALEARLIDDLLDLTAIRSGKVHLQTGRVDMHQLVRAVVEMVGDALQEKAVEVDLELGAAHPWVLADQARMHQVLWNVVRNAVKFSPRGARITIGTADRGGSFLLWCRDAGIGISAEALPRIFRPFEQADAEVARSFGGLGLGLAIAHGLVVQHGGRIEAQSAGRGAGTTFTITLPSAPAQEPLAPASATNGAAPAADRKRVLLVEDNEDAGLALAMCLEEYGYVVDHVTTCAAALRAAEESMYDAVLTDIGLPDGSGIDVGRALAPRLPVLALSGYGQEQDRQRSAEAGFSAHLVKPADPAEVHAHLAQVLSSQAGA